MFIWNCEEFIGFHFVVWVGEEEGRNQRVPQVPKFPRIATEVAVQFKGSVLPVETVEGDQAVTLRLHRSPVGASAEGLSEKRKTVISARRSERTSRRSCHRSLRLTSILRLRDRSMHVLSPRDRGG